MIYFVDGLLWAIALGLGLVAASRSRVLLRTSVREGSVDCVRLLPRIMLGVVGSGYIAALLPQEVVGRWLGADSGVTGLCIAMLGGAFTPGGPVIGFSICAALGNSRANCWRLLNSCRANAPTAVSDSVFGAMIRWFTPTVSTLSSGRAGDELKMLPGISSDS